MRFRRSGWILFSLALSFALPPDSPAATPVAGHDANGHRLLWQHRGVRVVKLSVEANSVSSIYEHRYALLSFPVSGHEALQGVPEARGVEGQSSEGQASEELAWQPLPPQLEAFDSRAHCVANLNATKFLSIEVEVEGLSKGLKPRWNGSRVEEQSWRFGTANLKLLTVMPGDSVSLPSNGERSIIISLAPVSFTSMEGAMLSAEAAAVLAPDRDGAAWKNVARVPAQLLFISVDPVNSDSEAPEASARLRASGS
jgi:hypothetical protein